jgi:hypothetical protein
MKTIVAFIISLLIATDAWAQVDHAHGIVWLPAHQGTLHGSGYHHSRYQMGLRNDGVVTRAVEAVKGYLREVGL